jgi:hypothetical protein
MAEPAGVRGIRIEVLARSIMASLLQAITVKMAKGCTPYMTKAAMSGRLDEIVDLEAANLCAERRLQWT